VITLEGTAVVATNQTGDQKKAHSFRFRSSLVTKLKALAKEQGFKAYSPLAERILAQALSKLERRKEGSRAELVQSRENHVTVLLYLTTPLVNHYKLLALTQGYPRHSDLVREVLEAYVEKAANSAGTNKSKS
jgi:hypothetical protein